MKKIFLISLSIIQLFSLFLSIILFIILKVPFVRYIYTFFYKYTNLASKIGISTEELNYYTDNLLLYLQTDSILDNTWYSKKDILHMIDVKNLYQISLNIFYIFFFIFISMSLLLYIFLKTQFINFSLKYFNKIFFLFIFCILCIISYIVINFNSFWINFHLLVFSNDLWLLSPNESNLIKMFPENFFLLLVSLILILIVLVFTILFITKSKYYKK